MDFRKKLRAASSTLVENKSQPIGRVLSCCIVGADTAFSDDIVNRSHVGDDDGAMVVGAPVVGADVFNFTVIVGALVGGAMVGSEVINVNTYSVGADVGATVVGDLVGSTVVTVGVPEGLHVCPFLVGPIVGALVVGERDGDLEGLALSHCGRPISFPSLQNAEPENGRHAHGSCHEVY